MNIQNELIAIDELSDVIRDNLERNYYNYNIWAEIAAAIIMKYHEFSSDVQCIHDAVYAMYSVIRKNLNGEFENDSSWRSEAMNVLFTYNYKMWWEVDTKKRDY